MDNVCADQKTFNKAVRNAVRHLDDDDNVKNQSSKLIVALIMLTFYFWAILLAMRVTDPQHRVLHVVFALCTGPLYVLAYYLGMMDIEMK
ncbi:MAG: hypothetical protein WCJ72_18010 [Chryseobacterium sp.]